MSTRATAATSPRHDQSSKDIEDDSLSSRYVYPQTKPFVNSDYRRSPDHPLSSFPDHNRQAVMAALKNLQDKIKRLEYDRSIAEGNLRSLASETTKFKDMWSRDHDKHDTRQSEISKETQELEIQLNSAESRCNLLEKQLDYMRKLVENAEKDKQDILRRQTLKDREHLYASENEIKSHIEKIGELERDQLKLTATQTLAENKIRELEDQLKNEKRHRKMIQEKTAEIETAAETNRILLETVSPVPDDEKPKCTKKKKATNPTKQTSKRVFRPAEKQPLHYHLNLAEIPFLHTKSTSPSHHVGANVQTVLSMLKSHNAAVCGYPAQPQKKATKARRPSTSSQSSTESDLTDLLLQLHDEFALMSFDHQELTKQINEAQDEYLREDLERELEALVSRMEIKGDQIARLKRHQQNLDARKRKRKTKPCKSQPKSAVSHYTGNNENSDEVQVTTTIRTKGKNTRPIHMRSSSARDSNLKMLQDMKKLQTTLRKDDLSWEC